MFRKELKPSKFDKQCRSKTCFRFRIVSSIQVLQSSKDLFPPLRLMWSNLSALVTLSVLIRYNTINARLDYVSKPVEQWCSRFHICAVVSVKNWHQDQYSPFLSLPCKTKFSNYVECECTCQNSQVLNLLTLHSPSASSLAFFTSLSSNSGIATFGNLAMMDPHLSPERDLVFLERTINYCRLSWLINRLISYCIVPWQAIV